MDLMGESQYHIQFLSLAYGGGVSDLNVVPATLQELSGMCYTDLRLLRLACHQNPESEKSYCPCQKQQLPPKDLPDLTSEINTPPMLYYSSNRGYKNRLNKLSQIRYLLVVIIELNGILEVQYKEIMIIDDE